MKKVLTGLLVSLLFGLIGASPALAQDEVTFSLRSPERAVSFGETFRAVVHARIQPGWHLYALTPYPEDTIAPQPTTITLQQSPVFEAAGGALQPQPSLAHDENFDIDTYYFDGVVDFELPVRVRGREAGEFLLNVHVRFMACNDRLCLPPQVREVSSRVQIESSAGVEQVPGSASPAEEPSGVGSQPSSAAEATPGGAETGGSGDSPVSPEGLPTQTAAYIWFAMAMGGLALLTPCVFPMIPITVSYFTKREVSRKRAVGEAALYSLGIVLTFTLIGFLLTMIFGAGGISRIATNPGVNFLIAGIFVVFALSLFGVFEIRVPSSWLSAVDRKGSSVGGPLGILLMALTFSLTSFTCTVPFVGTVMVAATQGDWLWSLLGVTAFATVFSAPFFLLALFPAFLKSLPKSGSWMNSLKITMGFLELAAALKFLSNVDLVYQWELITRPVFITIWLALALVTALYLLGKFYFPHEAPLNSIGAGRVLAATFFLAVSFYLVRGLLGFPLGELDAFLPPRDYGNVEVSGLLTTGSGTGEQSEVWLDDYAEGLKIAQETGRPIFIDFTGYTCTNCRWMEANIFPRPEVRQRFREFVLVRLYTDGGTEEHAANLRFERERFGTIALPLYAIVSPEDETIGVFPGLNREPQAFIDFLDRGLEKQPVQLAQEG